MGLTHARRLPLGPARSVTTVVVLTHTNGVHAVSGVTQIYPETSEAPKGVQLQQDVRDLSIVSKKRSRKEYTRLTSEFIYLARVLSDQKIPYQALFRPLRGEKVEENRFAFFFGPNCSN